MSRKERVKTMLDMLKAIIIAFLTALFGLFGYAVINYEKLDMIRALGVGFGAIVLIVFLILSIALFLGNLMNWRKWNDWNCSCYCFRFGIFWWFGISCL